MKKNTTQGTGLKAFQASVDDQKVEEISDSTSSVIEISNEMQQLVNFFIHSYSS